MTRIVLAATDGTPASMGALRLARQLEEKRGVRVEVLGVVEPVPVFDAGFLVALPEMELYESRQEALRLEIAHQLEVVTGSRDGWKIRVDAGLPGPRIVKLAEELGADTILMGLGRHGPVDRMFGTETALQVIRVSHIPVLAVPEEATTLPRSAVLGVDFSHFSQRAADAAMGVMEAPWEIEMVHVMSGMEFLPTMSEGWKDDYEGELTEKLEELSAGLEIPGGCSFTAHVLEGEPSHQLLGFSQSRGTELLVAGSHGLSFVGRLLMGSVSTRLIRGADIPVLVIPPSDLTDEVLGEGKQERMRHPWVAQMEEFSKANMGRRTTLELDDPELGAQQSGKNFPLWGVVYDPKRDRVNIMLGRSGTVEGHLTHSIPGPQEITIKRDEKGLANALRIRLKQGQILLKIHRQ